MSLDVNIDIFGLVSMLALRVYFLQEFSFFCGYWLELRGAKDSLSHLIWVSLCQRNCFVIYLTVHSLCFPLSNVFLL